MKPITPHLWFDNQAIEAASFYASTLTGEVTYMRTIHDTPSGDVDVVSFDLAAEPFMAISAGPLFKFNPSVSFLIRCEAAAEVDELWAKLSEGGQALMPLDTYPFSQHYGWTEDKYGLSWQVMQTPDDGTSAKITPMMMYVGDVCGRAEEAIELYTSIFPDSKVGDIQRYGKDEGPDKEGTIKFANFWLSGRGFAAMDSAHDHKFSFNEAISFVVSCDTQDEIDHYWHSLSAVPEAEQCGWLKDKFGLSWLIVPSAMDRMMREGTEEQVAKVTETILKMKKFDIAELQTAFESS